DRAHPVTRREPRRDLARSAARGAAGPDHSELSDEAALRSSRGRAPAELGPPQGRSDPYLAALGGASGAAARAALRSRASRRHRGARRGARALAPAPARVADRAPALEQALRPLREGRMKGLPRPFRPRQTRDAGVYFCLT